MELLLRIKWRPGIGDPGPMGWLTVVSYLLAALLAWRAWQLGRLRLWLAVAVLMGLLGVNKQFDFQSLLTDLGRELARLGGWYEERRRIQKAFVLGLMLGAALGAGWLAWRFRSIVAGHKLLSAGLFFLLTFVLVRAVSFHHFDMFLKERIAGLRWNWILELGGIALVAFAAWKEPGRIAPGMR